MINTTTPEYQAAKKRFVNWQRTRSRRQRNKSPGGVEKYICRGGPWDGHKISVSYCGDGRTAYIKVWDAIGRYVIHGRDRWDPWVDACLQWQPVSEEIDHAT